MAQIEELIQYLKDNSSPLSEADEKAIREAMEGCRFIIDGVDPMVMDEFASPCVYDLDTDTVFYFYFINESTDIFTVYGFSIAAEHKLSIHRLEDGEDHFSDLVSAFESFGIHDFSASPTKKVEGIGYQSYEVLPEHYELLMNSWRMAFACLFDEDSVGSVVKLGEYHNEDDGHDLNNMDDAKVLSFIQAKMAEDKKPKPAN